MISTSTPLHYRDIFRFWYPLALTWAMMAVEGPILNSLVSRLPNQHINLAAFGVASSLAMIIESPVIMILSATVALAKDNASFVLLRRFTHRVNLIVSILMVVLCIPPVLDLVTNSVLHLEPDVSRSLHSALIVLILWPASIGYRRFYQGIMIRNNQTRNVAIGSVARIVMMASSSSALAYWTNLDGAVIGAAGLGTGVLFEALATRVMAREAVRVIENSSSNASSSLDMGGVRRFYVPLALTSVLGMAVNPMLVFFMGHFSAYLESLAVFPVVDSFVFQFRSPGFSYQEIGIALIQNSRARLAKVRVFGYALMLITTVLLAVVAWSPLLYQVYTIFPYRLQEDLAHFALAPTRILMLLPALSVLYSMQRAVLISQNHTQQVSTSTLVEVLSIVAVLIVEVAFIPGNGAEAAAWALVVGRVIANAYLQFAYRRSLRADQWLEEDLVTL